MARTAAKTGRILSELYDETFANDSYEPFRITWADLRGIAGVTRLTPFYLRTINRMLNESGYSLIPFDTFLVVTQEADLSHFRLVPPRLVEQYRYEESEDLEQNEDGDENAKTENDDDCLVNDEDVESA
jgi:hypothetical protein